MRLDYEVILEKGRHALIKRGTQFPEYAIVAGLLPEQERKFEGSDWDGTVAAYDVNAKGLSDAIDRFRYLTELDYIPRLRLEELATKFKDGLLGVYLEPAEYEEFFDEECEMDDYEKEFFGLNGDEE